MAHIPLNIGDVSKFLLNNNLNDKIQNKNEIQSRFSAEEKAKLKEAALGFESMMNTMLLKSMDEAAGGMFGDSSSGAAMFDTFFFQEISDVMSKNGGMGIADTIYRKMTGESLDDGMPLPYSFPPLTIKSKPLEIKHTTNPNAITPSSTSLERLKKYDPIIHDMARQYGVEPNLVKSIILAESAANEKAKSHANAKGLMQLIDSTAKSMGVRNVWDAKENIMGGTKYISNMLKRFDGNVEHALAAYNAGPHNVEKYDGIPPFKETKAYVPKVLGYYKYFESI